FPFAFLRKTRRVALAREIVVYPSVEPPDEFFHVLPLITGEFESFTRGRGSDLYRIREYFPEDSARHVDWKATAKSGSLKVREFAREDERRLRLVFDNPAPGALAPHAYERMVSLTASLAWRLTQEHVFLSFISQEYEGTGDIYGFLESMASVAPKSGPSLLETLRGSTDYSVVFTAEKRGTIPASMWATSYFV